MHRRTVAAAIAALTLFGAASAQQTTTAQVETPTPPAPRVTLETTMGAIVFELDMVGAPKTSAHMLRLFRSRHYVGASLFRIEPGFLIQLGDLDARLNYRQPPVGTVELETANNRHARGTVSLARANNPNSGRSSFYFDLAENAHLNADPNAPPNTTGYATFGKVVEGMEVLDAIAGVELAPTGGPFPGKLPKTPIVVTRVRIEHDPTPPPTRRAAPKKK